MNVSLSTAVLGAGAVALAIYLIDIWFPNILRGFRAEVDIDKAEKEIRKEQARVEIERQNLEKENKEVEAQVAAIKAASKADEEAATEKVKEVNKNSNSVKEYLKGEGFNVEEIFPE